MRVSYTETTYKNNIRKTIEHNLTTIKDTDRENNLINIYPQMEYQKLEGFGGAVTDSAGYVFSLLNEEQKSEMVNQYFSTENMAYNQVRIPIDSCDFSLEHYEADSDPDDTEFQKFSFARVEKTNSCSNTSKNAVQIYCYKEQFLSFCRVCPCGFSRCSDR